MSSSISARLEAKKKEAGLTNRTDIAIEDLKVLDKISARALFSYDSSRGAPSNTDILGWFNYRLPGEMDKVLCARLDTMRIFPEDGAFSLILERQTERMPISASTDMVPSMFGGRYIDGEKVWQVVEGDAGHFLVREDGTAIEDLMKSRMSALQAQTANGRRAILFATLTAPVGGYARANKGDEVDFFDRGATWRGTVTGGSEAGVNIEVPGQGRFTVDPAAILNVVAKGPQTAADRDTGLRRYLSSIWPGNPDMAKMVTPDSRASSKDPMGRGIQPIQPIVNASTSSDNEESKKKTLQSESHTPRPLSRRVTFSGKD